MLFARRDRPKPCASEAALSRDVPPRAFGAIEMAGRDYVAGWLAHGVDDPVFLTIQVGAAPPLTHVSFAPRSDIEAGGGQRAVGFVHSFDTPLSEGDRIAVEIHGGGEIIGSPFFYEKPPPLPCDAEVRVHVENPRGGLYRALETFSGWATLHDPFCDLRFAMNGVDQDVHYDVRPDVAGHFRTPYSIGWTFTCDVAAAARTIGGFLELEVVADETTIFKRRYQAHLASVKPNLVLFMHIPKTAGNSLVRAINQQSRIESHWLYGTVRHPIDRQMSRLSPDALAELDVLGGHFMYGLHEQIARRCVYISLVREPLDYLKSYFFYRKYVQRFTPFLDLDIYQALEARLDHLLDNGMTRFFAPKSGEAVDAADLLKATANMENGFAFVGLVERMEESLARISAMLRCDLAVLNDNRTPATKEAESIDPEEFARRAEPYIAFDRILYQRARQLFWEDDRSEDCIGDGFDK